MLARKFRLPVSTRFDHKSLYFTTSLFTFKLKDNNVACNRYGFLVSKRVSGSAVVRNRLKRRFRSCVEKIHNNLIMGRDMLFILKKEAILQTTEALSLSIKEVFTKANLLKDIPTI